MTPEQFRAARKALGQTQHELAETLRMGKWGFQSIGKWERGEIPVPGPVTLCMEFLLAESR